jgi:hypothetical protein
MDLRNGFLRVYNSSGVSSSLSVTGSQYTSGSSDVNTIQGSTAGGTLLNVLGTAGQLFTVTDGLSGSLFSVNTISGLPVLEAFSDFSFVAGAYGVNNLYVGNSKVGIMTGTPSATLDVAGNVKIQDGAAVSTSLTVTGSSTLSGSLSIISSRLNVGNTFTFSGSTVITGSVSIPAVGDSSLLTVGSAGSPYLLVTGSTGRVSVNTTSSVSSLNVGGTTNVLTVQGTTTEGNMFDVYGPSGQLFSVVDGLSGSLFSVNTISGVPVMEVFSDNSIRMGQYSNPPLVITGATASISGSLNVNSGNINVTSGSVSIFRSGSNSTSDALFDVEGAQGQLFSVIDSFSGSLMSVNDISGFPILDVRSDDTIIMGTFGSNALVVSGSSVIIGVTASAAPTVTGSNGQIQFAVVGGNAFIYAWLGGRWRSGSLA